MCIQRVLNTVKNSEMYVHVLTIGNN